MAYQLELPPSWMIHPMFHVGLLSPYKETKQYRDNYLSPLPEIVDGQEEFEVEAIEGHCLFRRKHKLQYLIKWKGYPISDNTWENQEDIFADDLIRQYHWRHPLKDKRTKSSRRVHICSSSISWPLQPPLTTPSLLMKKSPPPFPSSHTTNTSLQPLCLVTRCTKYGTPPTSHHHTPSHLILQTG